MPYLVDQNPGSASAMGTIMVDAPNSFGVYLHDTPGKALFQPVRGWQAMAVSALKTCSSCRNDCWWRYAKSGRAVGADIASGQTQRVSLNGKCRSIFFIRRPLPIRMGYGLPCRSLCGDKPLAVAADGAGRVARRRASQCRVAPAAGDRVLLHAGWGLQPSWPRVRRRVLAKAEVCRAPPIGEGPIASRCRQQIWWKQPDQSI